MSFLNRRVKTVSCGAVLAVLVATGLFAASQVNAFVAGCCGDAIDPENCALDYPYKTCTDDPDCINPNFPICCQVACPT
jgi:hypothetical protein